jgi:peptide/nickel transport system substrate-binding protein
MRSRRGSRNQHGVFHRGRILALALVALGALVLAACSSGKSSSTTAAKSNNTLVIAMTASDIPNLDTGLTQNQGYEGIRFVGNELYDSLTRFDLNQGTEIPKIIPSLATSWTSDPTATNWTFKLRPGVKFSDGTPMDADAAVFNLQRYTDKSSPQYYPELNGQSGLAVAGIKSVAKVDAMTISITTDGPLSYLPTNLATVFFGSPTAIKKEGNAGFAAHPVGTGPFTFVSETRGQELVMAANPNYWGGKPSLDKVILRPIPDPTARVAALKSGQVNWIEVPPPDVISTLKSSGYQIDTNSYDHIWPWTFDMTKKPWNDVRVRQAANYAIDRESLIKNVLAGTADPAYQVAPVANAAYRASNNLYSYDPAKAKQLLTEAGYPDGFTTTLSYPTSGSGNMVPTPMNEALQQDLAKVGIKVTLQPIEWAAMITSAIAGKIPGNADAVNISETFQQDGFWTTFFDPSSSINFGKYDNPKVDAIFTQVKAELDPAKRADLYAQASKLITEDAPWLFVVNDRNPRALSKNVHGFIEPKSWFVDLTHVTVS